MHTLNRPLTLFLLLAVTTVAARGLDLYVSPAGDDAASGAADKPFATIERARDEVRKRRPGGATVHVHGGFYALANPLTFGPQDSGDEKSPIVYEAVAGETPIVSGGTKITGWTVDEQGRWTVTLPAVARGEWDFSQLFVNGVRRFRPRLPKGGFYRIAGELPPTPAAAGHGFDRFTFNAGELKSSFKNLGDVEALCFSNWFVSRLRVTSVDDAARAVTFTGPTASTDGYAKLNSGWRYILENVAEALGEPGEWYLDRKTGMLTYCPMPGETIATAEVVAPRLDRLVTIDGDFRKHEWVHDIIFRGIAFEHANWVTPAKGHTDLQAENGVRGAIYARAARRCAFEECRVEHVGGYALELAAGCEGDRVERCVISDLGAGGVRIGEGGISPDAEANTSNIRVVDNLILHGGRTLPAGIGVFVLQASDNVVQHNEIGDFYYTGISSGWTWGYGPSIATGNQYLDNYVHDIGQGLLSDMGGIYTLGNHKGSVIRGNRFERVNCDAYGGWGIYFDEGTTDLLAERNLVSDTKTGGFHQHYGKDNVVRNNLFIGGVEQWLERSRVEPDHTSFTFERNVVIGHGEVALKGNWKDNVVVDHNVYWRPEGPATFNGKFFENRQKQSGVDVHSIFADPALDNWRNGDVRVNAASPATAVGFESFDVSSAGVTGAMLKVKRADAPRGFPIGRQPWE